VIALAVLLLLMGAALMLVTGLGLMRMPDIFTRMHAATKGASLGVAFMLLAAALAFQETGVFLKGAITVLFIFLTAPVAANLLARSAYAQKTPLWKKSVMDEGRGKISVSARPASRSTTKRRRPRPAKARRSKRGR
jgi:multicomponent Na+:H+ antiporter subunit G